MSSANVGEQLEYAGIVNESTDLIAHRDVHPLGQLDIGGTGLDVHDHITGAIGDGNIGGGSMIGPESTAYTRSAPLSTASRPKIPLPLPRSKTVRQPLATASRIARRYAPHLRLVGKVTRLFVELCGSHQLSPSVGVGTPRPVL